MQSKNVVILLFNVIEFHWGGFVNMVKLSWKKMIIIGKKPDPVEVIVISKRD